MPDQRGCGRLPVRAGDGHDLRTATLWQGLHSAGEQFHVADDRHIGHFRHPHNPMRLREFVWHAGGKDERGKGLPVAFVDV